MSFHFQPHNWHLCFSSAWSSSTPGAAASRCSVDLRTVDFDGNVTGAELSEGLVGKTPSAKPSCAKKDRKKYGLLDYRDSSSIWFKYFKCPFL